MMSRIYKEAEDVTIWLGPAYGNSDIAIGRFARTRTIAAMKKLWRGPVGPPAIAQICERRYWSRLWVIQEIVLARKVNILCGEQQVRWLDFQIFMYNARGISQALPDEARFQYDLTLASSAARLINQVVQARGQASLFNQVIASAKLRCYDLRDKIYGVLCIVGEGHESIVADYEITMPTLLNRVLKNEFELNPPRNLVDVRKRCEELTAAVGIEIDAIFALNRDAGDMSLSDFEDIYRSPFVSEGIGLWWAHFYDHKIVQKLWLNNAHPTTISDALVTASLAGHEDIFLFLLEYRESESSILELYSKNGGKAWKLARQNSWTRIVSQLLHDSAFGTKKSCRTTEFVRGAIYLSGESGASAVLDDKRAELHYGPLELAAQTGLLKAVQHLLTMNHIKLFDRGFRWAVSRPLACGRSNDHEAIRQLLLEKLGHELHVESGAHNRTDIVVRALEEGYPLLALQILETLTTVEIQSSHRSADAILHSAIREGQDIFAFGLLQMSKRIGFFADCKIDTYTRALNLAVAYGRAGIVQALLWFVDLNPNLRGPSSYINSETTALEEAIQSGRRNLVHMILQRSHVDVNMIDANGAPILHRLVLGHHYDFLQQILQRKDLDVNRVDQSDKTALQLIVEAEDRYMLSLLLARRDLDVNIRDKLGRSMLTLTIGKDLRLADDLLGRTDMNSHLHKEMSDFWADPPLVVAIKNDLSNFLKKALKELTVDVDVAARWSNNEPPLHYAVRLGRRHAVRLLSGHDDIDINWACCKRGQSALSIAIHNGDDATVDILLRSGRIVLGQSDGCCIRKLSQNPYLRYQATSSIGPSLDTAAECQSTDPKLHCSCPRTHYPASMKGNSFRAEPQTFNCHANKAVWAANGEPGGQEPCLCK